MKPIAINDARISAETRRSILTIVSDWERVAYGENCHRNVDDLESCIAKQGDGFFVAFVDDQLAGYADLWQLNVGFYQRLRAGLVAEEALAPIGIVAPDEESTGLWYVGSVILRSGLRKTATGGFVGTALSDAMMKHLHERSSFPACLMGVGSSAFGEKVLVKMGFEPVTVDPAAIDHRPRYERRMRWPQEMESLFVNKRERVSATTTA